MAQKKQKATAANDKPFVLEVFTQDKVCKHSVRYAWTTPSGQQFSIYVPSVLLPNTAPQKIGVTIELA